LYGIQVVVLEGWLVFFGKTAKRKRDDSNRRARERDIEREMKTEIAQKVSK
jgi:hypothetical protein